jgi:hypothetical protein
MKGVESPCDDRYVVSDERLAEIRSMFKVDDFSLTVRGNVTLEDLAWALDDLLVERDDRE